MNYATPCVGNDYFCRPMENIQASEWFAEWFDSPYYHVLYNHRDEEEATFFIDNLIDFLKPDSASVMLDLACGRGRHAVHLHKKGFEVVAVDLAPSNIEFAKQSAAEGLQFMVHDMRNLLSSNTFDYVFNLFTSFGYFNHMHENLKTVKNMAAALKPNGRLILDFMNVNTIKPTSSMVETKHYDGFTFNIQRKIEGDQVVKQIEVVKEQDAHLYEERVKLLNKADFESFFASSNLLVETIFGGYDLSEFDAETSDRLIFIARKA